MTVSTIHNAVDGPWARQRRPGVKTPSTAPGRVENAFVFLVPCLMCVQTKFVGQLFLTEVVLLLCLPLLIFSRARMLSARLPQALLLLCLFWLLGQVTTDVVRGTPCVDYSRGWAKILFTLTNFMSLYLLLGRRRAAIETFVLGWSFGQVLAFKLAPNEFAAEAPWKFGVGIPLTLLVVLVITRPAVARFRLLPVGLLWSAAAVNIALDFRSLGGVCFFTGVYLLLQRAPSRTAGARPPAMPRVPVLLLAAIVLSAAALSCLYQYAASHGLLGSAAQDKYEAQSSGSYGILLGGRTESVASTRAILDSPLIGHGSWAKDPDGRYYALIQDLTRFGYKLPGDQREGYADGLIPTHSHLLGAWVEAGVLGAVFWLWVLRFVYWVLVNMYPVRHPATALIVFLGLLFGWDILFVVLLFAVEIVRQARQAALSPRRGRRGAATAARPAGVRENVGEV